MKDFFKVLLTFFLISSCVNHDSSSSQNNDFTTIDVTIKYPKKELILQDFLDVEYIPLETNDEFTTAGYVQAIGKNIILVRNTNQAGAGNIFIFNRRGKGLKKINRRGQGNGEYTAIMGVTLDEENEEIFVNCGALRKILVYDLSGNFRRSLNYMNIDGKQISQLGHGVIYEPIYNFDRDNLIVQDFSSGRFYDLEIHDLDHRNIFWIISKQDGSITMEIQIPFAKKIFQTLLSKEFVGLGMVYNWGLIPYKDEWILTETSADTIYSYSMDHEMSPFVVRTPSIQKMDPEVFIFPGVITDRYVFLQTVKKEYDSTEPQSNLLETDLVYDKEEKRVFEYTVCNDDFTKKRVITNLVHNVPVLTVINDHEIAFAEKIEAFELVEAYEKGQLKGKLNEIAATLDEESNPVIMLAKYKK